MTGDTVSLAVRQRPRPETLCQRHSAGVACLVPGSLWRREVKWCPSPRPNRGKTQAGGKSPAWRLQGPRAASPSLAAPSLSLSHCALALTLSLRPGGCSLLPGGCALLSGNFPKGFPRESPDPSGISVGPAPRLLPRCARVALARRQPRASKTRGLPSHLSLTPFPHTFPSHLSLTPFPHTFPSHLSLTV